ncbi:hypothetical protein [Pseudoalteromonas 'SMAR']|uniref:hypothetical protein n=1 Tax=Pseudoalteromonas 'SMAR' TaxID=3416908 RepID=UPI003AF24C07
MQLTKSNFFSQIEVTLESDLISEQQSIISVFGEHFIVSRELGLFINNYNCKSPDCYDEIVKILDEESIQTINEIYDIFKGGDREVFKPKGFLFAFDVINAELSSFICGFLGFTFNKLFFLCFLSIFSITLYVSYNDISYFFLYGFYGSSNYIYEAFILYFLSVILHEFGHASACRKFSGKSGGIGFGVYYIFPVLYANVNQSWLLPRKYRIIIALSGVYYQLIFLVLVMLLGEKSEEQFYYLGSFFILISIVFTLNPILKFDGYWALLDCLGKKEMRNYVISSLSSNNSSYKDRFFSYAYIFISLLYSLFLFYLSYLIVLGLYEASVDLMGFYGSYLSFDFVYILFVFLFKFILLFILIFSIYNLVLRFLDVVYSALRREREA